MTRTFRVEKVHSDIVSKGTLFKALKYIDRENPRTPVLLLDREKVREKVRLIGSRIGNSRAFYALKANADPEVARLVHGLGMGFEVASEGELALLRDIGVPPEKVISSNPVKSPRFIEEAASYGVSFYAYDSRAEVQKMASLAPGVRVYVRLSVPNEGSDWPLSRKFGVELDEALALLVLAAEKGLNPVGITFHVGSQCLNKFSWNGALYKARALWERAEREGLALGVLNIGGGYPITYTKSVVGVEAIEKTIEQAVRENFPPETEVFIEPGRAVVGDAGVLVASVIGKAGRLGESWVSLDVGVFNGLMESVGGITYSYIVESSGKSGQPVRPFVLAGPSCDSFDVVDKEVWLPEPRVGGMVLILSAGAYTVCYASEFNGFSIPRTILI
jgi:ornithine decarboxylase